nr:PREDICTED: oxidized low-density lipoprotein receptor 1-like isoform X2 [Anolis carolinensis]|eukprot:XP_016846654.1 PREDICTED: oxidized low-density lipoprotein receptor 1-like isoform X2 [Anolis carolinensis]
MLEMAEEVTYADLKFITLQQSKKEEFHQTKNKVMQASQRVSSQNENLTLQKEMFENLLTELNVLQAQNLNLSETVQQLSSHRGRQCSPCPEKWLQRGDNCYFFSTKWNTWEEGKSQCITLNSRFLKIESKEELEFILESAQSYNSYWIGLFRSRAGGPWLWDDNSTFITDL